MSVTAKERSPGERPPIIGRGRIVTEHKPGKLYAVEMPNGHRAYAVVYWPKGETPPTFEIDQEVRVQYSPYDMTRCKIITG